ncbi:uncharacterized protein LOC128737153 [Sabethes cyaneus]|uniref:uncharacterized protein LOC128737153 n=1 Tax=Sabethes cyaneus TaxID=53552 RepID=UPI00237DA8A5|nr:uncharacterized protein LOC128737153 [Sabethes cyaneus]
MIGKIAVLIVLISATVSAASQNETEMIVRKEPCTKLEYYDRFRRRCQNFPGGGYFVIADHSAKCVSDDQGLHKFDRNDFYYVCHPDGVMIGMCPSDMVFDETEGKCVERKGTPPSTVRVYDESENCDVVIPNCNQAGVFAVPSNCSFYYDCQEYRHGYQQFVYRCPYHTMYHPDLHRCTTMTRCYPIPYEIFDRFSGEYFPRCVVRGQFRTSNDCSLYYRCIPNMDGSYFQIRYECPPSMQYSEESERCIPKHSDECLYLPLDKIISNYLAKHNLSDGECFPQLTTAVSTINTTIIAHGHCSRTTLMSGSECSLTTTKLERTTKTLPIRTTPTSRTRKSTLMTTPKTTTHDTTHTIRVTQPVTQPSTSLSTELTDSSEETTTDEDITETEPPIMSTEISIPTSTSLPNTNILTANTNTTVQPNTITDDEGTTPHEDETETDEARASSEEENATAVTDATDKSGEFFTWDEGFERRAKLFTTTTSSTTTTTVTPTTTVHTSGTTPCIQFGSNESEFPDSDYWDKSLSRESWESATESTEDSNSSSKCKKVYCLNSKSGGLSCDDVTGTQRGRMMIPGYIIRYRQRSNADIKRDPQLDAGIELRLRFPNSYRIEAIARKDLHQAK